MLNGRGSPVNAGPCPRRSAGVAATVRQRPGNRSGGLAQRLHHRVRPRPRRIGLQERYRERAHRLLLLQDRCGHLEHARGQLAGGALLGLLGALIAIPVAASVLIIYRQVLIPRMNER